VAGDEDLDSAELEMGVDVTVGPWSVGLFGIVAGNCRAIAVW
jgi:hypothetical protein